MQQTWQANVTIFYEERWGEKYNKHWLQYYIQNVRYRGTKL